jgi:hypothetical protein
VDVGRVAAMGICKMIVVRLGSLDLHYSEN